MVDAVSVDPAVAAALTVVNNEVRSSVSRSLMLEVLLVTEVPEPRAGKCVGYATTSWSYRTTSAGRAVLLRSTGLGILLPGTVMGAAVFIFSSVYRQKNWPAGPLTFFLFQGNRRGRSRVARQQIGYLRVPKADAMNGIKKNRVVSLRGQNGIGAKSDGSLIRKRHQGKSQSIVNLCYTSFPKVLFLDEQKNFYRKLCQQTQYNKISILT